MSSTFKPKGWQRHPPTAITIPDGVVFIGSYAFYACFNLSGKLALPSGLKSIEEYTFYQCRGLNGNLTIPTSVTSIGAYAFYDCLNLAGALTIPTSVTNIGAYAFYDCDGFSGTPTIPSSVTSIGTYAFYGCDGFSGTLTIPSGVSSLGNFVFAGCKGLSGISIPEGVTSIAYGAFSGCDSVKTLSLPSSLTSIDGFAFASCWSLGAVSIPSSVSHIGICAFYNCKNLTAILPHQPSAADSTSFQNIKAIIVMPQYLSFCKSEWTDCSSIVFANTSVVNDVLLIENNELISYFGTDNTVVIPDNVEVIDYRVFFGRDLTSVTIGKGVRQIGDYAFEDCTNLTEIRFNATNCNDFYSLNYVFNNVGTSGAGIDVVIGMNVKRIPAYFFYQHLGYLPKISSVTFESGSKCESIGSYAFYGCRGLSEITIPERVVEMGIYVFFECRGLTEINFDAINCSDFPEKYNAFYQLGTIDNGIKITIGKNVERIPAYFVYGFGLKKLEVVFEEGSNCKTIAPCAFFSCRGLLSVAIPESVERIERSAFAGCTALTTLTIGSGVTTIEDEAFWGCSLEELHYNAVNCSDFSSGNEIFSNAGNDDIGTRLTIGKSVAKIPAYFVSSFADQKLEVIFEEGSVCKNIGAYAFFGCSGLTAISIPQDITSIEDGTFYGCSGLTAILIPQGVTSIGCNAFFGCSNLLSVTIPKNVKNIGAEAFANCYKLTTIDFDATNCDDFLYGSKAFSDVGKDASGTLITIGKDVVRIPAYSFNGAGSQKLDVVFAANNCKSIGRNAFANSDLTSITLPESLTNIEDGAFWVCRKLTSINFNAINCNDFSSTNNIFSNAGNDGLGILVTIGKNVTRIPSNFLSSIYSQKLEVVFADNSSCESIGANAFNGCKGLYNIKLPQGLITIGNYSFYGCSNLKNIILSDSLTTVGICAFYGCSNLTSISIPNNVISIETYAFGYCDSLTVYAEATSRLSGWSPGWDNSSRPVVWGCTLSDDKTYVVSFTKNTISYSDKTIQAPYRAGYVFGGWYTSLDFSDTAICASEIATADAADYYAKWIEN